MTLKGFELGAELRKARKMWPELDKWQVALLRSLFQKNGLSVSNGEITRIDGHWYVTHAGLLQLAQRRHCLGITTSVQMKLCDPATQRWVFRAVVHKTSSSKGFVGYGDADPSNVSPLVRGSEMRIAETRATCRALRKAYGIGLCSAEELGASISAESGRAHQYLHSSNGDSVVQPRLRDQLWMVVRQFQLDPTLVKHFAVDFCGVESLAAASRESIMAFVAHLRKSAEEDRAALLCKLNSYAVGVKS